MNQKNSGTNVARRNGENRAKYLVDLVRFELTTSSMPWKRAPNCATGPRDTFSIYHALR